jgi:Asp-tRNA(Asn)/Glu-tRNA(Gln) amidotransferase A subunit family amidase
MTILLYEAARSHAERFRSCPECYGEVMLRALERGFSIGADAYSDALETRVRLRNAVNSALDGLDLLMLPTVSRVAPLRGDLVSDKDFTRLTMPFNLTGHPVLSLPWPGTELPVGMQLVGRLGADHALLASALEIEGSWASDGPDRTKPFDCPSTP